MWLSLENLYNSTWLNVCQFCLEKNDRLGNISDDRLLHWQLRELLFTKAWKWLCVLLWDYTIRVCIFSEGQKFGQEKKRRYIIHKCKVSSSSLIHRFRLGSIYFSKLDFGIIFFYGKKIGFACAQIKGGLRFLCLCKSTTYW